MLRKNPRPFACCLIFALVLVIVRHGGAEEPVKMPAVSAEQREAMRREWEVWEQLDLTAGRKITKARIVMQLFTFGPHEKTLDVEIDDAEVLKLLESGIGDARIWGPRSHSGAFGAAPTGSLICTTTTGKVHIYFNPHCFTIGSVPKDLKDIGSFNFHSPTLAHVCNAILKSHGHAPFSDKQREGLTGEYSLKIHIRNAEKEIAETEALRAKEE